MTPYQLLQHFVFVVDRVSIEEFYINSLGVKTPIKVHVFENVRDFSPDFSSCDCFYKGKVFHWHCYLPDWGDFCLHVECVNSPEVMS